MTSTTTSAIAAIDSIERKPTRRTVLPTYTAAEREAMIADQAAWSRPASRAAMLGGSLWS